MEYNKKSKSVALLIVQRSLPNEPSYPVGAEHVQVQTERGLLFYHRSGVIHRAIPAPAQRSAPDQARVAKLRHGQPAIAFNVSFGAALSSSTLL